MATRITPVRSPADIDTFVKLPWRIYARDPAWVPPLIAELKKQLDRRENPFFEYGEAEYFLAWDGDTPVGRITSHVNPRHNERHGDKTGFFGFFESVEDQGVASALFEAAEQWLRAKGMKAARGPMSFTINDEVGILVDGFDYPPKVMMPHSRPYYGSLVESCGYSKVKDLFAWDYCAGELNPVAIEIANRVRNLEGLVIREVRMQDFDNEIRVVMDIFNSAWAENWGFVPFTEKELRKAARDLKLILDPRIALIAEYKGQPCAISIALPDLNQLIRDLDGRLGPLGLFKLLYRVKRRRYDQARLMLLGIKKEFRGGELSGLSVLLYVEMHERTKRIGLKGGELGWTLEDNERINRGIELMGGKRYKTYRVYEKPL